MPKQDDNSGGKQGKAQSGMDAANGDGLLGLDFSGDKRSHQRDTGICFFGGAFCLVGALYVADGGRGGRDAVHANNQNRHLARHFIIRRFRPANMGAGLHLVGKLGIHHRLLSYLGNAGGGARQAGIDKRVAGGRRLMVSDIPGGRRHKHRRLADTGLFGFHRMAFINLIAPAGSGIKRTTGGGAVCGCRLIIIVVFVNMGRFPLAMARRLAFCFSANITGRDGLRLLGANPLPTPDNTNPRRSNTGNGIRLRFTFRRRIIQRTPNPHSPNRLRINANGNANNNNPQITPSFPPPLVIPAKAGIHIFAK